MAPTASPQRRRLSAILNADIVGYSRMMAEEEAGTLARLQALRVDAIDPCVTHHHGRLVKLIGDGALVEFPSAVDAINCAVAVQQAVTRHEAKAAADRPLVLRIGISIGDVIVEGDDIYGDAVNMATRLQEVAEPGGICISETVYRQVVRKVDHEFARHRRLQPGKLDDDVAVYTVLWRRRGRGVVPRTPVDVSKPVPGFDRRPAIALLPFANIGGGRSIEHLLEGLTEDIAVGLSSWRRFPVISRHSTAVYRNNAVPTAEVAAALGARYVLEGSVRQAGDSLRVSVQLVDAHSEQNIWSRRYDLRIGDIFEVQDEITRSVVAALEPEIEKAEQVRSFAKTDRGDLTTWDLVRRGMWHQNRLTREDAQEARRLFDQALERDPHSVEALVQMAWWYFWDVWTRRGPSSGWAEMERYARRAQVLDDKDYRAYTLVGIAQLMLGHLERGREALLQSIELNPSQPIAHSAIGTSYILAGRPQEALQPLNMAIRLSPHDLYIFHALGELAVSHHMLGEFAQAADNAERSLSLRGGYVYAHVVRIGALARAGRQDRAQAALDEFVARRPNFRIGQLEWLPFVDRRWPRYLMEGLRLAGYEEAGRRRCGAGAHGVETADTAPAS